MSLRSAQRQPGPGNAEQLAAAAAAVNAQQEKQQDCPVLVSLREVITRTCLGLGFVSAQHGEGAYYAVARLRSHGSFLPGAKKLSVI